jgi:hypothetical protein
MNIKRYTLIKWIQVIIVLVALSVFIWGGGIISNSLPDVLSLTFSLTLLSIELGVGIICFNIGIDVGKKK